MPTGTYVTVAPASVVGVAEIRSETAVELPLYRAPCAGSVATLNVSGSDSGSVAARVTSLPAESSFSDTD